MSIKAVFFDLDGTLLDTAPDFVITLNQLAQEYKLVPPSAEKIRQTISNGARALITLLFNIKTNDVGFEERRQRLLDIYSEQMGKHCTLFEGMDDLLQSIKQHNLCWGIITNKPLRFAEPIVSQLLLPKAPDILICPDHVTNPKPSAEPLLKACEQLNYQPQQVIYIGDHRRDIDCGINAGCKTIAAAFGYIHENENIHDWRANYVVDHSRDIWPIIQSTL